MGPTATGELRDLPVAWDAGVCLAPLCGWRKRAVRTGTQGRPAEPRDAA